MPDSGTPTAPVTVVPEVPDDARMRDLIGRVTARVDVLEQVNKDQAEELAMYRMMEGEPAPTAAVAPPPAYQQPPFSYPLPQPPVPNTYPPYPPAAYPAQAPVASAYPAPAQVFYRQDPNTGQFIPIQMAAPTSQPAAPPAYAPVATPPASAPTRTVTPEAKRWQDIYDRLADDLQYFGKMHPRLADAKAAEIVREAVKSGDLNAALRSRAKEDDAVLNVLRERVIEDAKATGMVMPEAPPAPGMTPEGQPIQGEPFIVQPGVPVVVASSEAGMPATPTPRATVVPAATVVKPQSTTPTSPPPAEDGTPSLIAAAKAEMNHIDKAFGS